MALRDWQLLLCISVEGVRCSVQIVFDTRFQVQRSGLEVAFYVLQYGLFFMALWSLKKLSSRLSMIRIAWSSMLKFLRDLFEVILR